MAAPPFPSCRIFQSEPPRTSTLTPPAQYVSTRGSQSESIPEPRLKASTRTTEP